MVVSPFFLPPVALAALAYVSIKPSSQFWGPAITHGPANSNRVGITFDDGPTAGATEGILDILAAHQIKATFFVIGVNCQRCPDLLRRIHEEGHLVGNHTWDHWHYSMLRGPRYWRDQLRKADDIIEKIIGTRPTIFRPPMGVRTCFSQRAAERSGHRIIAWSRRANDGFPTTPQRIVQRLTPAKPGDILLLHDGIEPYHPRDPQVTIDALPLLLEELHRQQLQAARVDELLSLPAASQRS